MAFYLFRKTSGEVIGSSVNQYPNLPFDLDQVEIAEVTDPSPWIYDLQAEIVIVRTATQAELLLFPASEALDALARTRSYAAASLQNSNDHAGQLARALALTMMDEVNRLGAKMNGILDAIDGANSLAGLKSTVAAIADNPERTGTQVKTAVESKLNNKLAD